MTIVILSQSRILLAEKVDCPTCRERAPWRCRAKSGKTTDPHVARRNLANCTPEHMLWAPIANAEGSQPCPCGSGLSHYECTGHDHD